MKKKSPKNTATISIIVNAHNEDTFLHRTLKSIQQNIDKVREAGAECEVIIVADRVNDFTKEYLDNRVAAALVDVDLKIEYVQYGDLGESRNHGIKLAKGEYIANFDGDDIWSDRWLVEAYVFIQGKDRVVLHPEIVVSFGAKHNVWHVKSSTDPVFDARSCVEDNWWTSCMFTRRSTFDEVTYRPTLRSRSFSFEDWLWNLETLAKGIEHLTVPKTSWFYRRKSTSMLTEQIGGIVSDNALLTPSGLKKYKDQRSKRTSHVAQKSNEDTISKQVKTESIVPNTSRIRGAAVRAVRKGGKAFLKVGKKYIKPRLESHHRAHRFAQTMVEATRDLLHTPNATSAPSGKNTGPEIYNGVYVPDWVVSDWRKLNDIDPGLFPTRRRLHSLHARQLMTMGPEQAAYWKLAERIGESVDYMIMTPWLKTSGASLVVLRYANAYIQNNPKARVVVVATEDVDCPWEERLDERIHFVKVERSFTSLTQLTQSRVIAQLMVQLKPKRLHIIHSQEAFRAINLYAPQITLHTKLYLSIFAYDYSPEGMRQSAFLASAEPALPYTTKIFCDNQWIIDDTVDIFGVSRELFTVHKLPFDEQDEEVQNEEVAKTSDRKNNTVFRVLWASRIAKAKRPDILYEILKEAHSKRLEIEFTIYGELYGNSVQPKLLEKICKLPNVKYMGGFSKGITNIADVAGYDAFLFTSEGEGMPNAIIEAQSMELPVIASAVGGVPETVISGKTGIPVAPYDNIDGYIAALEQLMKDRKTAEKLGQAAKEMIKRERSWGAFVDTIKADL
ncbi:MAG TPA: glycosyltransferase [Candidatus Saccharimonadales bacterium]